MDTLSLTRGDAGLDGDGDKTAVFTTTTTTTTLTLFSIYDYFTILLLYNYTSSYTPTASYYHPLYPLLSNHLLQPSLAAVFPSLSIYILHPTRNLLLVSTA